ncbi:odorant receptor 264 [Tribolium castaneum]|uniref:Odorant receptor n=1 Tax=Tribolium castaneum TaxID=7070 RepID=D7EKQ0_TRICA|nr:PREDICTED: uncharacterized protein LOC107398956 [Tribolium castaneum]EFA11626.1 odorant receptor 264 [Tribolium castaneum]|eukprot:XP_015840022.1 PREDICTED: uncharacterized protein LOC107398956 [Tribolium castaneum]
MVYLKDPFITLRVMFLNFNKYKIVKCCDFSFIIFYSLVFCLQIYYLISYFSANPLIRYATTILLVLWGIVGAILSVTLEKQILEATAFLDEMCWPLNMVRKEAQTKLERSCRIINIYITCSLLLILITVVFNMLCFSSQRDFFINIQIFEEYFGELSHVFNGLYFTGFPYLCYHGARLCYVFVYAILQIQLQFSLIEEYLLQVYEIDCLKSWRYLRDTRYQQEMGKSLRLCITHHNALKKFVKMINDMSLICMPFCLVLGVLILISCLAFVINFGDTLTIFVKLRILIFVVSCLCVLSVFCWSGQQLTDVSSYIFLTLARAPWYYWRLENIKILLTFSTNCTKNDSIVLAGIRLEYMLFVSMLRISCSYALVLFNLRK